MNRSIRLLLPLVLLAALSPGVILCQYNTLWIPDTLTGKTFALALKDTFTQFRSGNQTITAGVNNKFWGPTLFFQKGDTVHLNVHSYLNDSTTVHWHGMHLPAVMDGGPHQIIPPGTIWQPYWKVTNNAATYWYHPHLHEMTQEQMTKGIGGFIIVRDSTESALALPRTYGVDDIPLALTSRRFDASNAFVTVNCSYGDSMLTNGTLRAQVTLPKQYVRLRILDAEMERGYNLGFSDNRTFYVIGNDGGLLNTPVAVTRVKLMVGERVEILVNLGGDAIGSSLDLKAYNSGQAFGFPGGEPNSTGQFGSYLNNKDFNILHINVGAATANPITSVPSTLVNNTYWTAGDATVQRTVTVTGGGGPTPFSFDNTPFVFNTMNKTVNLNNVEQWTITNNNIFGHSFHIHDVEFKIISRSGGSVANYESGWKDVLFLPVNSSATFVAKFDDYADSTHPFMYHCHFAPHEDGGMMGQFIVVDTSHTLALTAPTILGIAGSPLTPQLLWTKVSGATRYRLQVARDSAFTLMVLDDSTVTDTALVIGPLADSSTYYWRVRAGNGTSFGNWSAIAQFGVATGADIYSVTMRDKWNLLSIPIIPSDPRAISLFPTSVSALFKYQGTYAHADSLAHGPGYWAKFSGFQLVSVSGTAVQTDTIPVSAGWNLIGSVSNALPVTEVTSEPAGIISSGFFTFGNGYSSADTLEPFNGHWVKVSQDGVLILNSASTQGIRDFVIHSAPGSERLSIAFSRPDMSAYYVRVLDTVGRTKYMLPQPDISSGIDIGALPRGNYVLQVTDGQTKRTMSKLFVKQ